MGSMRKAEWGRGKRRGELSRRMEEGGEGKGRGAMKPERSRGKEKEGGSDDEKPGFR